MKITKISYDGYTSSANCYGSLMIPCHENKKHQWTIKIIKKGKYDSIGIGMTSSKCQEIDDCIYGEKGAYSYWSDGDGCNDGDEISNYGNKYGDGSIIRMIFSGNDNILSFEHEFECKRKEIKEIKTWWGSIKNEEIIVKKKEIKKYKKMKINDTSITYKMFVCMYSKGSIIELLEYSCSDICAKSLENKESDSNKIRLKEKEEIKTEEIDSTLPKSKVSPFEENKEYEQKPRIMDVEKENKRLKNENESLKGENGWMNTENNTLKEMNKSLNITISSVERENNIISQQKDEYEQANLRQRARIISLEKQIEALRNERDSIQNRYEQIKNEKNVLIDDYKELQIENKELKEGIERLKLQQIDEMEYENWNSQQVLIWILSLNGGRYNKYKDILSKNLFDEGIKGIHLKQINVLHIKGWGIHNFEDKEFLMQKIQLLINQNDDNNMAPQNNEGAESGGYYK